MGAQSKVAGTTVEQSRQLLTEAEQRYQEAVAAKPRDAIGVKCLGDCFFVMGELDGSSDAPNDAFESAAKQYDIALKLCPSLDIPRISLLPTEHSTELAPSQIPTGTASGDSGPSL